MRVLACGGRRFRDVGLLNRTLDAEHAQEPITLLIQGGQREWDDDLQDWIGADWLASEWARKREVAFVNEPAKWRSEGWRAAGPKRNGRMQDRWKPEKVIAFPGGRGTADMVRRAKAAGVKVIEVPQRSGRG